MKRHPMLDRTVTDITAILLLATSTPAVAQRGIDRALTGRYTDLREVPESFTIRALQPLAVEADTVFKAMWLVQPLASVTRGDNELGLLAGYKNSNRITNVPWQLTARAVRHHVGGVTRQGWQTDLEIDPPLPRKLPLLGVLSAQHAQIGGVQHSNEIAAEADVPIVPNATLTIGVIVFYDWISSLSSPPEHGGTFGITGYWERGRLALFSEYDFSSAFLGDDSYHVVGSLLVHTTSRNTKIELRGGWQKEDTFSLRLQLGVAHEKRKMKPKQTHQPYFEATGCLSWITGFA